MNQWTERAADDRVVVFDRTVLVDRAVMFELVDYYEEQLESARRALQQRTQENDLLQRQKGELAERLNRYDRVIARLRGRSMLRLVRRISRVGSRSESTS